MSEDIESRIAVLETRVSHHSEKLDDTQLLTLRLMDKLDKHMEQTSSRDEALNEKLNTLTQSVNTLSVVMNNNNECLANTNEALKEISIIAKSNNVKWIKQETRWATIIKMVGVATIAVSAMWAVYTFIETRPSSPAAQTTTQTLKK